MATRPPLRVLGLNTGKKARSHRILFQHGLRNGTAIFLPYDQGLEHGPATSSPTPSLPTPGTSSGWHLRASSTALRSRSGWLRSSTGTSPARCR
jgi:DhnA family fructose-bisphosphate aldolase class Ia